MRISDWSSDVCSSDLKEIEAISGQSCSIHMPGGLMLADSPAWLDFLKVTQGKARILGLETEQIGRASCRERVCSVRVDLGGRRIIKKKNNKELKPTQ